jgi:uncharacterized protein (TIGR04255 family)
MAAPRHLRKAPITEAIIDIRVPRDSGVTAAVFADLREFLRDQYPIVEEPQAKEALLTIEGGKLTTSTRDIGFHGLLFKSADTLTVVQFRADGFTLNRLKPYTSWEELFPEVIRLWPAFVERAHPREVSRIALRYINHLEIPFEPNEDFAEYLTASPPVPPELPQLVGSFLMRVVLHDPEHSAVAIVTQSLGEAVVGGTGSNVLLDIDVYRTDGLALSIEELRPHFEALRELKNRAFFYSLTERTVRLFE